LLIAEILTDIRNELCLALMYSIALTFGGRLHKIQIRELENRLSNFVTWNTSREISVDEELRSLASEHNQIIHLNHDLWNDLLLRNWSELDLLLRLGVALECDRVELVSVFFYPSIHQLLNSTAYALKQLVITIFLLSGPFSIVSVLMDSSVFSTSF